MQTTVRLEDARAELEAVLSSGLFAQAPSLALFLSYVCSRAIEGHAGQIKEYSIAVEALGRSTDFDQKKDSIVRVEAHRLRKRLQQFYEGEGANRPLQIVIPSGQYVPMFVPRAVTVYAPPSTDIISADGDSKSLEKLFILPRSFRRRALLWALGVVALLATAVLLTVKLTPSAPTRVENLAPVIPLPPQGDGIRILAGATAPFVDRLGNIWLADRYFHGGEVYATSPGGRIMRSRDAGIFENRRQGTFAYDIPLKPGTYELRLYFAETVFGEDNLAGGGETSRIFNVTANGRDLIRELDVVADAHGSNTADVKVFKDISPAGDGYLHLVFSFTKESAFLNAIAIQPGTPGRLTPVRIVARDSSVTSRSGDRWTADRYFTGGQTVLRTGLVSGTADPEIYRGERYGHFDYVIPVPPGRYTVTLKFAESWFGSGKAANGGVSSRVFDVFFNGVALLRHFDIFKEAGGADRALDKTFRGLQPNAQGKLVISFIPVQNYACVNAIEVVDEGR